MASRGVGASGIAVLLILGPSLVSAEAGQGAEVASRPVVKVVAPAFPVGHVQVMSDRTITIMVAVGPDGIPTSATQVPELPLLKQDIDEAIMQWRFAPSSGVSQVRVALSVRAKNITCAAMAGKVPVTQAVFQPPYDVEVWTMAHQTCDPVVRRRR